MDKSNLYRDSSNALMNAKNLQMQISQKELELELIEINSRYRNSYEHSDRLKIQNIKMDIDLLTSQRDTYISNAIDLAIDILNVEIDEKNSGVFSLGSLAIGSINSFISSMKPDLRISITSRMKLSQVSSKLLFAGIGYMDVSSKIDTLKRLLRTY